MAAGLNKVQLIGNLGADPEIRYTPGGTAVANFDIATTESYKNKEGEKVDKTTWHKIAAFGKLAEICGEYLKKGRQVYVEGSIDVEKWEDKEGNKRSTTKIIIRNMQMLGNRDEAIDKDEGKGEWADQSNPDDEGTPDDVPF